MHFIKEKGNKIKNLRVAQSLFNEGKGLGD
jgi:hypothetical protein